MKDALQVTVARGLVASIFVAAPLVLGPIPPGRQFLAIPAGCLRSCAHWQHHRFSLPTAVRSGTPIGAVYAGPAASAAPGGLGVIGAEADPAFENQVAATPVARMRDRSVHFMIQDEALHKWRRTQWMLTERCSPDHDPERRGLRNNPK